jgi:aspartate carbamoyltransferase catalytic subunit
MKPEAIIMHPGPVNRGVELSSAAVDTARNLLLYQVNAGVAVRMALMYLLLGGEKDGLAA